MSLPDPDGHERVGERAGAGEVRVDVDHLGAARLGLHHPLEPDGMGLGHVRAHDHDAVGVDEPVRSVGGAATPERGSQTGNGGGVSNTGLVLDLDGPERGEQLLDEVVLLVVQRRPAQAREPGGAPQDPALARRSAASRGGGRRAPGRPPSPWRCAGRGRSTRWRPARGSAPSARAAGPSRAGWRPSPWGTACPREIGEAGLPSIWMTFSSFTNTCCAQPTAQYGHTDLATRSAVAVRGVAAARARRLGRGAPAQPVRPDELPVDRPRPHERPHPLPQSHACSFPAPLMAPTVPPPAP